MDAILAPGTRRSTRAAKIDYASAEARKNAALEDEEVDEEEVQDDHADDGGLQQAQPAKSRTGGQ